MNRRHLLSLIAMLPAVRAASAFVLRDEEHDTEGVFKQLIDKSTRNGWNTLPIGMLMGNLALELRDTPYVGGTLEGDGPEMCRVDLLGLDCVTYFENVLGIARIIKKGKSDYVDLQNEITYTRYRGGVISGYASRLHYTAEWIHDNILKGVVRDVTEEMGGVHFKVDDHFMSTHPQFYKPLTANKALIKEIKNIETQINAIPRFYVTKADIVDAESNMQTGDIVAVATSKDGLDYAHTGMIYRGMDGDARFLHASTTKKKVVLDVNVSEYVRNVSTHIGITVVRPMEPSS